MKEPLYRVEANDGGVFIERIENLPRSLTRAL